jgi:hypothetical protein
MTRRIAHAAQIGAIVLALALVPVALAAKGGSHGGGGGTTGGGGGGSSVTLKMVTDSNSDGLPNWGDTVTFYVSTTVTTRPYVQVDCYQNGVYVYSQWAGFYADFAWPWLENFTLSNSMWTSGGASCTATLYYTSSKGTRATIMTQGFQVGA